jgi:hypothetical protein
VPLTTEFLHTQINAPSDAWPNFHQQLSIEHETIYMATLNQHHICMSMINDALTCACTRGRIRLKISTSVQNDVNEKEDQHTA